MKAENPFNNSAWINEQISKHYHEATKKQKKRERALEVAELNLSLIPLKIHAVHIPLAQERKNREEQRKIELIKESNNLGYFVRDPWIKIHNAINKRDGIERSKLLMQDLRWQVNQKRRKKPGWGTYRNQTRDQIIKAMEKRVRLTSGAILDTMPEDIWEQILKDPENNP